MANRVWLMRVTYVALAFLVMFVHLLPLQTLPRGLAPPDLLLALTFAWVLRRPDYVPGLLVGAVFLLMDLMLQRPPGLYAALVVMGCEFLKTRASGVSDASFLGEWTTVAIVMSALAALYRVSLGLVVVLDMPLALMLAQLAATVAIYPIAVLVSQIALQIRKPTPADAEAMGART